MQSNKEIITEILSQYKKIDLIELFSRYQKEDFIHLFRKHEDYECKIMILRIVHSLNKPQSIRPISRKLTQNDGDIHTHFIKNQVELRAHSVKKNEEYTFGNRKKISQNKFTFSERATKPEEDTFGNRKKVSQNKFTFSERTTKPKQSIERS